MMKEFSPERGEDINEAIARYDAEWNDECMQRVPELEDIEDDEFFRWQNFLEELDTLTADEMAGDMEEAEEYLTGQGLGWIEDMHGAAVFIPLG